MNWIQILLFSLIKGYTIVIANFDQLRNSEWQDWPTIEWKILFLNKMCFGKSMYFRNGRNKYTALQASI
jgi:hypothetical protein